MPTANSNPHDTPRMPLTEALRALADARRDEVVITTMGASREWPKFSEHPLDFHYLPSTMGGGPPIALGLALAQPQRHVIVLCGDGSLLMNLGCLVTIAASSAANVTVVLTDNGVYEVTGGQQTPARSLALDFAALASASGFPTALSFDDLAAWQAQVAKSLALPGPRFITLRTEPVTESVVPPPFDPIGQRIERFMAALCE